MGVMERMRNSTGIILWVLIGSFGLLWVLADVNFFDALQAGPNSLGAVMVKRSRTKNIRAEFSITPMLTASRQVIL